MEHLVLPSTLKTIGASAFRGLGNLKELVLPEGLETIGAAAFKGNGIDVVTLPASLGKMGRAAFKGNGLSKVIAMGEAPAVIGDADHGYNESPFAGFRPSSVLYVPAGTKAVYASSPFWQDFFQIEEMENTGIDGIATSGATSPVVCNLIGIRMNVHSVEALPAGVYIVDGKRTVVR